jgi:hypothetical protein
VEPDRFRSRRIEHPTTGERVTVKEFVRKAIDVPVCERHAGITTDQPLTLVRGRTRGPHPEQLDLFNQPTGNGPASAIYGDAA